MELRQSPQWGRFLESLGWQTEIIDGCALRVKRLGLLGCIIKIQRPDFLPLEKINAFAKRNRALFVKIEPVNESQINELKTNRYKLDTWPLTPARTIFLDLTKNEEELLKSFSKDTRQMLKRIKNQEVRIKPLDFGDMNDEKMWTLESFYKIWKVTGQRSKFYIPPFREFRSEVESFAGRSLLITSHCENWMVSGCLILICNGVAYYHHAASTIEGQNLHSPYGQMWQAILEAKKRGCKKLDLEGIFDPRFKSMFKSWLNFSAFKLKWGGEVYEYPGSFTKAYNPLIKLLFKLRN